MASSLSSVEICFVQEAVRVGVEVVEGVVEVVEEVGGVELVEEVVEVVEEVVGVEVVEEVVEVVEEVVGHVGQTGQSDTVGGDVTLGHAESWKVM